jgi:hypothetical protein
VVIVGNAGTTGSGGQVVITGAGGQAGTSVTPPNPDAGGCQMKNYTFEPKIPTVYLLVDRSGSMFDCISTAGTAEPSCPTASDTSWVKLRDGILPVVQQLQADVRFGFATISGSNPSAGGTCPMSSLVMPALNNYGAIMQQYNNQPPAPNSTQSGMKWETPTAQMLQMVGAQLAADTTPGEKYVLFVTDGEPDYCGDGNSLCPPDSVIWRIQQLKAMNIGTIVFGIMATFAQDLPPGVLDAFATAGAGQPTVAPLRTANAQLTDFVDQCFNMGANINDAPGGWTADFLSVPANAACATDRNPCRGRTLGTYMPTKGPATAYRPDVTNQQALINQLSTALAGVKSCVFDLTPVRVNLNMLEKASVLIEGQLVPLDTTSANGWNMISDIQLQLFGSACDTWRNPNAKNIQFNFPCDIIID